MNFFGRHWAAALAALFISGLGVSAQSGFPSKPITLVVGFPPGVPADVMARIMAPKLSEGLGQPVIVENRPGAASNIGAAYVAKSAPDGHTIYISSSGNAVSQNANKVSFSLVDDFKGVSLIADVPGVLVAHASMPKTLREFIAQAKAKPDTFAYGTSGPGSSGHLFTELLSLSAGMKLLHVPYKGSSQTLNDLIAGHIQIFFSPMSTVIEHVKSGSIHALAVMGKSRATYLPDVPTFSEIGFEGFESAYWFGTAVPRATPDPIVQRLNSEFVRVLALPDVREKLLSQTIVPVSSTSAELEELVRRNVTQWSHVVKAAGIKAE
jgi:tripartite-type tricarboxylate transporter receptor subunit TctC